LCCASIKMTYITFALITLLLIIIIGIYVSKKPKDLCTYCLKTFHNTTQIHDQVSLCEEHYTLYKSTVIAPFLSVRCDSENDENGIFLYNVSQNLKKSNLYNHIISSYELEGDQIITIQTLYCEPIVLE